MIRSSIERSSSCRIFPHSQSIKSDSILPMPQQNSPSSKAESAVKPRSLEQILQAFQPISSTYVSPYANPEGSSATSLSSPPTSTYPSGHSPRGMSNSKTMSAVSLPENTPLLIKFTPKHLHRDATVSCYLTRAARPAELFSSSRSLHKNVAYRVPKAV